MEPIKPTVIAFIPLLYGKEFMRESLLSIIDHVDKVHIAAVANPSYSFGTDLKNPDSMEEMKVIAQEVCGDKLIWELFDKFDNEADHLLARYRHSAGFNYIMKCDLDEIFLNVPEAIEYAEKHTERFYHSNAFTHLWRTFSYGFTDNQCPQRLEKLSATNTEHNYSMPLSVVHLGYCQNLNTIKYKFGVFSHKDEVFPDFLETKFLSWHKEKINEITDLHPTIKGMWMKPTFYDKTQMSNYLRAHPRFFKDTKPKILFLPMNHELHEGDDKYFGDQLRALQKDNYCKIYDGSMERALAFEANIILFQAGLEIDELQKLKDNSKALVFMYSGDCRYLPPQSLINYKSVVDVYLLPFSGKTLQLYQDLLGKPCHFLWEPIQDWRYVPNQHINYGETVFVGNDYDHFPAERRSTLDFINKHTPARAIGEEDGGGLSWVKCPNRETPTIYNDAYLVICENNYNNIEDYFTPRNLGAMAAGSCALMRVFPGIEKHFQNLTHCLYYRDKYELLEWIEYLYKNPSFRNHIAEHGFKLANDKFSCMNWAEKINEIVKQYFTL